MVKNRQMKNGGKNGYKEEKLGRKQKQKKMSFSCKKDT